VYSVALAAVIVCAIVLPRWTGHLGDQPLQNPLSLRVSLEPGLVRGGGGVQITLPAATRQVQFELALPQSATDETYHAVLETPERPQVWNGMATREGKAAIITIPSDLLAAGDYTIDLEVAGNRVANYYFRVLKTKL
jgi:hypothetical protein